MVLVELGSISTAVLPIAEFANHLHLGTGFAEDGDETAILEAYLRAGISAIETRIGKAMITREYSWQLTQWHRPDQQVLPVAPVSAITEIRLVDAAGTSQVVDPDSYYLVKDSQRPRLVSAVGAFPSIASAGGVEIDFQAGYGPAWSDMPVDLAQAVFLLAAHYYENRHATSDRDGLIPFGVMALIETYRKVRILGGGA